MNTIREELGVARAALLDVRGLRVDYQTTRGTVRAVDDVSFTLGRGEILGLVGESGCGKSATALAVARLIDSPPGRISAGEILFEDTDLLTLGREGMRAMRGKEIGYIFQDPLTSLNPTLTVGRQIEEAARAHLDLSKGAARQRATEMLDAVGIARPRDRYGDYPHEFSGGMRQRVMIAMALVCQPKLVLADEPTTALDVTVQAQILELIASLCADVGTAVLLITHDLGIAAEMCHRVNIMYAGQIVESGTTEELFGRPQMPYTWGLLDTLPRLDDERTGRLRTIGGLPPSLIDVPGGCRFAPRCAHSQTMCREAVPALGPRAGPAHYARCWGTEVEGWLT